MYNERLQQIAFMVSIFALFFSIGALVAVVSPASMAIVYGIWGTGLLASLSPLLIGQFENINSFFSNMLGNRSIRKTSKRKYVQQQLNKAMEADKKLVELIEKLKLKEDKEVLREIYKQGKIVENLFNEVYRYTDKRNYKKFANEVSKNCKYGDYTLRLGFDWEDEYDTINHDGSKLLVNELNAAIDIAKVKNKVEEANLNHVQTQEKQQKISQKR